jgi:hypothetical protein
VTTPQFPEPADNAGQQFPAAGQPPFPPGAAPPGQRPARAHRARNVMLLTVGLLVVVAAISAIASNGGKSHGGAGAPAVGTTTSAPAVTTPALSASEQQFVSDLQSSSQFNISSSTSSAQIADYGQQVCGMRQGRPEAEGGDLVHRDDLVEHVAHARRRDDPAGRARHVP